MPTTICEACDIIIIIIIIIIILHGEQKCNRYVDWTL